MTNALTARTAELSTKLLKEMARELMVNLSADADTVMSVVLGELAKRLPEAEFVAFADAL